MSENFGFVKTLLNGVLSKINSSRSNWSENDPAAPGYVHNRTHWTETVHQTVEFDGNLTGTEHFELDSGLYFVKMLDEPLTINELIGTTVTFVCNVDDNMEPVDPYIRSCKIMGENVMKEEMDADNYAFYAVVDFFPAPILIVVKGEVPALELPIAEGVYFLDAIDPDTNNVCLYTKSLSCLSGNKEVVHKLDKKYLPEIGAAVPDPTKNDEGKVLAVTKGTAKWVDNVAPMPEESDEGKMLIVDSGKAMWKECVAVPEPGSSNEGAFLCVSNGVVKWTKLNNAEEGRFGG